VRVRRRHRTARSREPTPQPGPPGARPDIAPRPPDEPSPRGDPRALHRRPGWSTRSRGRRAPVWRRCATSWWPSCRRPARTMTSRWSPCGRGA